MKVRIVSYSQPSSEFFDQGLKNVQDLVAFCARVSNPSNQFNSDTSSKLINYLIKNKHWSPLEMTSVCLEITTTRDIARQILRHRSFSFQEFSQRYANPVNELEFELREARLQDPKNRQNSIPIDINTDQGRQIAYQWENLQKQIVEKCKNVYDWAISKGIAKEQARAVLPEGLTVSRLYMAGTIRSWIHYIELRSSNGTQEEHCEIAKACAEVIKEIFPLTQNILETK